LSRPGGLKQLDPLAALAGCFPPGPPRRAYVRSLALAGCFPAGGPNDLWVGEAASRGSQNSTLVPSPGALCTRHHPPAISARSRMEPMPKWVADATSFCVVDENPTPSSRTRT